MKDLFSHHSDHYARYRPGYPSELFEYLKSLVEYKDCAWDCGTGNGQVAFELAKTFRSVFATDISQAQLDHAIPSENIYYSKQPAEQTGFDHDFFDLIVVAQAIHWFDFSRFYKEVRRVGKKRSLICVMGYGRIIMDAPIDHLISHFYEKIVGPYWDKERKYIDDHYVTIPFPFAEMVTPKFEISEIWDLDHLAGYLSTWSAVKKYTDANQLNPVSDLRPLLERYWKPGETKQIRFPLLLRIGWVN